MPGIDEVQVTVTTTSYECELLREGYRRIAGVDEAGRGALAGPVVAAAVILPLDNPIEQLTDSKLLTAKQRQELCRQIQDCAIAWAVGVVDNGTIDAHNILIATHMAMRLAVEKLSPPADFVLIDGLPVEGIAVAHRSVVGGDRCCYSIAAASIIAKVTRDGGRALCIGALSGRWRLPHRQGSILSNRYSEAADDKLAGQARPRAAVIRDRPRYDMHR